MADSAEQTDGVAYEPPAIEDVELNAGLVTSAPGVVMTSNAGGPAAPRAL